VLKELVRIADRWYGKKPGPKANGDGCHAK